MCLSPGPSAQAVPTSPSSWRGGGGLPLLTSLALMIWTSFCRGCQPVNFRKCQIHMRDDYCNRATSRGRMWARSGRCRGCIDAWSSTPDVEVELQEMLTTMETITWNPIFKKKKKRKHLLKKTCDIIKRDTGWLKNSTKTEVSI